VTRDGAPRPILLPANQPTDRPYRGGRGIARFRGCPHTGEYTPEDFVASTTEVYAGGGVGLTRLADGRTLAAAIRDDPVGYLGDEHVQRYGPDPRLLVKLLDTAERLFVHFHPDDDFARQHLGRVSGKTEAWYVLGTEGDAAVWLGFREDVPPADVERWYRQQDAPAMLAAMHRLDVAPGDSVFVPAGTPHALGPGITLVELQQPEDLSILLEYRGYRGLTAAQATLGLPTDLAWTALNRTGWTAPQVRRLVRQRATNGSVFPPAADRYFRAERHRIDGVRRFEPGYELIVVLAGAGVLATDAGAVSVAEGATVLVPYGSGDRELSGHLTVLRCRPPRRPAATG